MLHLVQKVFYPNRIPRPFMYVDTTWKFHRYYYYYI
ncbi:MAG: hypothetical protein H8E60_09640 [Candidatus Marinimicrobia bacterium]|nr:hypothetical protein [Candidatus Neomarinimicrobiota bacterium]